MPRPPRARRAPVPHALALAAATAAATLLLARAGLPSPALFAGLAVGLLDALCLPRPFPLPARLGTAGQAAVGVTIGTLVQLSTLAALGEHWLPVLLVTLATLLLSLGTGWVLGRHRDLDAVTGAFALVAGGASGLVVIARQLGADERVVAVVQYVRVLLVVLSLPVVLNVVFGVRATGGAAAPAGDPWAGVLLVVVCGLAGPWLGRRAHLPAHTLLGPLLLAAVASLTGLSGAAVVPDPVQQVAYALIGLQIGLRFTPASLLTVARVLPAAVALVVVGVLGSAGLGVLLSRATGLPELDTYLATTPGGLYAVLAAAVGSGADATFVLSVQVLRLLVMLLAAPALAGLLARARPGPDRG
ncbi:AbrB family transcriptional regulator [Kineococcus radiotolerans]|uniref:Ammonia monooxygenase n=1 Tax=Kineococcus radiotolerans (strain ATCC BAA-149 / DSM 14245 / SRS30216) TaxID=266940 RepID=A6WEU3_KINRD|nr:AbrB family transcriptional regulator [Kineococcus radiotolerans]ABS05332.1 putative ammonia monooxygenase [Kineococcus radiotolerans SRS30216 = ATCC BAA-149]